MPIPQKIFRAYDIRGTYPDELNAENAALLGRGFAAYLIKNCKILSPKIVVGRDNRTHGEELQRMFIETLAASGCHVTDAGLTPSPLIYFAGITGNFDASCNVTASHNPKQYNGFKLTLKNAHAVFGEDLQKLYRIIEKGDFPIAEGSLTRHDFFPEYLKKIQSMFQGARPMKIVIDSGNGVSGPYYPKILEELGHTVIPLFAEPDGSFPNHEPDPVVEKNLGVLKQKVLEEKTDLGIAFDGDGDRMSVVTEKGDFITPDKTFMLLARDALSRQPGGTVVFTVSNSQILFDLIPQWGGHPVMCKVGHSFVEDAMRQNKAVFGGEQSGHYFLPENYYSYDDALAAACRTIQILSQFEDSASAVFAQFPKTFATPELRPKCPDIIKFDIIEKTKIHFQNQFPCNPMDGVRIDFGNGGWAGIRASNTSPCLSIVMEAKTEEELMKISAAVLGHLKTYPEVEWK